MDVALQWRGYCIGIKLVRDGQVRCEARPSPAQMGNEPAVHRHEDKAWKDYIIASGSRLVSPIR